MFCATFRPDEGNIIQSVVSFILASSLPRLSSANRSANLFAPSSLISELLGLQLSPFSLPCPENPKIGRHVVTFFHFAGTTRSALQSIITESMGCSHPIVPSLATDSNIFEAFNSVNYSKQSVQLWKDSSPTHIALGFINGHYRCLEFFCRAFGLFKGKSLSNSSTLHADLWRKFSNCWLRGCLLPVRHGPSRS